MSFSNMDLDSSPSDSEGLELLVQFCFGDGEADRPRRLAREAVGPSPKMKAKLPRVWWSPRAPISSWVSDLPDSGGSETNLKFDFCENSMAEATATSPRPSVLAARAPLRAISAGGGLGAPLAKSYLNSHLSDSDRRGLQVRFS